MATFVHVNLSDLPFWALCNEQLLLLMKLKGRPCHFLGPSSPRKRMQQKRGIVHAGQNGNLKNKINSNSSMLNADIIIIDFNKVTNE
jgi:hypothetical protein